MGAKAFFSRLRGTYETLIQIGKGGSQWKVDPGDPALAIQARNPTDTDYARVRCADPVDPHDAVNLESLAAGTVPGVDLTIEVPLALVTADSLTSIPANARIKDAQVIVETPYSGGTTITVGRASNATLLTVAGDTTATVADTYDVPQYTSWGGTAAPVRVTIAGGPVAGAGRVVVTYTEPLP